MGKKSAERHAQNQEAEARRRADEDRSSARAAREPLRQRIAARRKAIDAKDFDNAPDFIGNKHIAAERNKVLENTANLTQTGIAGLASSYANPDTVAMAAKLLKDRMAQTTGGQWEGDVNQYIQQTGAQETDLANADAGMFTNFYNTETQRAHNNQQIWTQIAMQRAAVLPSLIGAGIGGVAGMFTGRFGGGGRT